MDDPAKRLAFLVFSVALVVIISGCIGTGGGSGGSHSSVSSGIASSSITNTSTSSHAVGTSTSSTTSSSSAVILGKVSFKAVLKVLYGSSVVSKYSYSGTVDYASKLASVSLGVIHHPGSTRLTGNWHSKQIKIENGTVRVFNAPPASWSTLSGKVSVETEESVFYGNPYYTLVRILGNTGNKSGNFSLELTPSETLRLLEPMMWGHSPPEMSLHGWVVLKNGRVTFALLKGKSGDTEYLFEMEVLE